MDLTDGRDLVRAGATGRALVHAVVRLDAFREAPLSAGFLDELAAGLARVRDAGLKVILRFAYNDGPYPRSAPDAAEAVIHAHLGQLRPLLEANADVLFVLEAGFVGAWGEWHSSTHGLDADPAAKNRILGTLLAATPGHRMVALRFPSDVRALVGEVPEASAFSTAATARVGSHQDCFLGSEHDLGTWGAGGAPAEDDKAFVAARSRYTIVGGETCRVSPRARCDVATAELERMHWTYLNGGFHPEVLARLEREGCLAEISRRLGYRLELRRAGYRVIGDRVRFAATIANVGYAAPVNPRKAFLVLERGDVRFELPLRVDPRAWAAGEEATFVEDLALPAGLDAGRYRAALWLPDLARHLRDRPAFAIRLANRGTWDGARGFNRLGAIALPGTAPSRAAGGDRGPPPPPGAIVVDDFDGPWPSPNAFGRWAGAYGFTNGGGWGAVEDGALILEYDGDGWYGTGLPPALTGLRWLVLRVRGGAGGEQAHIGLRLGGVDRRLADATNDVISTAWADVRVDLDRLGVDRRGLEKLELYFWNRGRGRLELGRISLHP